MSDPALISELFAKDPLHLTREDKTAMVEHFRKNRALWVASGQRAAPAKAPKKAPPAGGLSLEDLEL
jgi:hypothetical protein